MSDNIQRLTSCSELFSNEEQETLRQYFNSTDLKKDPLIPEKLNELPTLCSSLNELQVIDNKFNYPEAIKIIIKACEKNSVRFWEISNPKKVAVNKNPTTYLLSNIQKNSPLFHKFFAILCIWDHLLDIHFNKEFKKSILKGTQIDGKLSEFSKDLSGKIEKSKLSLKHDIIIIAIKIRNSCIVSNDEKFSEEYKKLKDFIDTLLIRRKNYNFKTQEYSDRENDYLQKDAPQPIDISGDVHELEKILGITGLKAKAKKIDSSHAFEIIPKEIASKSESFKKSYTKASQWRRTLEAQFLDNGNECLTPAEEYLFIDSAIKDDSLVSTQILISVLLGAEPHLWSNFKLSRNDGETWLDLENKVWGQSVDIGVNPKIPNKEVKYLFEESNDTLILPLADNLVHRLKPLASGKRTLGELFEASPGQIFEQCNAWIRHINDLGRNISVAKLRDFLYFKIMHTTFDEAAAIHLPAQRVHKIHRSITYTNFSQSHLQKIYTDSFPQLKFS